MSFPGPVHPLIYLLAYSYIPPIITSCSVMCRYYILVLAIITPFFAVANAYGTGLTDFDMSSVYGTVSLLLSAHLIIVLMA